MKTTKILVDDLGRVVGRVLVPRGSVTGTVEYGLRDADGILHVHGHATCHSPSEPAIRRWLRDMGAAVEDLELYD